MNILLDDLFKELGEGVGVQLGQEVSHGGTLGVFDLEYVQI